MNINLLKPIEIKKKYKLNLKEENNLILNKKEICSIINGQSSKFLIICGPCSIHDYKSSIDYGIKLKNLSNEVKDKIFLVMRAYLEKPRTSIGWKGIINDPYIDGTCNLIKGIEISRKILIDLIKLNIPLATELLNPIIFKYINDLYSWISIGARTSESQIHREIISYLSIPTGFKNSTDGSIESAINSIKSSSIKNTFLYINNKGKISIINGKGNKNSHIILRGGKNKPNYYKKNIINYSKKLKEFNVNSSIIIDCSHDNSKKNYKIQKKVINYIIKEKIKNNLNISGIMIESNLYEGNQKCLPLNNLKYGISITDECLGWNETKIIIKKIYKSLNKIK